MSNTIDLNLNPGATGGLTTSQVNRIRDVLGLGGSFTGINNGDIPRIDTDIANLGNTVTALGSALTTNLNSHVNNTTGAHADTAISSSITIGGILKANVNEALDALNDAIVSNSGAIIANTTAIGNILNGTSEFTANMSFSGANTFYINGIKGLNSGGSSIHISGNLGLGIDPPTEKLDVSGNIKTTGNLDVSGNIKTIGNLYINNLVPRIWLQDSNHLSAALYSTNNKFQIIPGDNNDSTTFDGTKRPFNIDLTNSRVGINSDSPVRDLQVGNFSGNRSIIIASGNDKYGEVIFGDGSSGVESYRGAIKYVHNTNKLELFTNSSARIVILEDGKVGIGTGSPTQKLDVDGSGRFTGDVFINKNDAYLWLQDNDNITAALRCDSAKFFVIPGNAANSTTITTARPFTVDLTNNRVGINKASPTQALDVTGQILASSNITAYSDESLKNDIAIIENALEKVKQIRGVTFTRSDLEDSSQRHTGVIAQEVEKVLPEVVQENGESRIKSVAYGNMVGLLIEAIKELSDKVSYLESQLSAKE